MSAELNEILLGPRLKFEVEAQDETLFNGFEVEKKGSKIYSNSF